MLALALLAFAESTDPAAGVADPAFAALLRDHWEASLRSAPVWATSLGDHRWDDRLGDGSLGAARRWDRRRADWLARARALPLSHPSDVLSRELFVEDVESDLAVSGRCHTAEWKVSARENALTTANGLVDTHPVTTVEDGDHLLDRYRALPRAVRTDLDNLREGLAAGRVADAESVRRAVEMIEAELARPASQRRLSEPAAAPHADWSPAARARFASRLNALVAGPIQDALRDYLAFLRDELLPRGRPDSAPGLASLPGVDGCYAASIRRYTTLDRSPEELHRVGLTELARIQAEMVARAKASLGVEDFPALAARLRSDPSLHFATEAEVEAKAADSLARALARIPDFFGLLPKAPCVVTRIPAVDAPYTYIAYYSMAAPDGSKPGEYFINTFAPETRPRFEAEALAWHEAVPGHHMQYAIAQELAETPAFRRHAETNVYVEGWALYTEQLADEMGLYSSDMDRVGMGSFEAWRAARLVVDTGLHAKGWSRKQAEDFMLANTVLAENNIRNEVDRYIGWPGQALAYKTGQMEIWRLRRKAEAALGPRFDLKGFHDCILGGGPVTLPVLGRRVEAWIAGRAGASPSAMQ